MSALHFPVRPSLEHARKAAKSLIRALRDRDPGAAARMRRSHPRCAGLDEAAIFDAGLKLADAQLVVAREAGAESWPRLVQAIASAGLDFRAAVDRAIEAAIDGHLDQARALLASRPEIAEADVHAASTFGQSEALGRLLAKDPSLATARGGPRGWEPLLYLALSRFLGRDAERSSGMRVAARMLLDAGADPNAYTVMGSPEFKQTPLYGAAGLAGDPELTRLLLEAGADPNDDTEFLGSESLYHASEHADTRCLQLLLEAGPDPDKVSYCLGRALDFENPRAVALYLRHGADPNFRNPFGRRETRLHKALIGGRSPEIIAMLLDAGADPALGTADGHGALALALRLGRSEAAELIRAKGATWGGSAPPTNSSPPAPWATRRRSPRRSPPIRGGSSGLTIGTGPCWRRWRSKAGCRRCARCSTPASTPTRVAISARRSTWRPGAARPRWCGCCSNGERIRPSGTTTAAAPWDRPCMG